MYNNAEFIAAINTASPRIAFRLMFPENEVIDSFNWLTEASLELESPTFVGMLPSWKLTAKFIYDDVPKDYKNTEVFVELGAYDVGQETIRWCPMGFFTINDDSQENDEIMQITTITAYDDVLKLNKRYEPIASEGATGRVILEEILTRNGINFVSEDLETLEFDDYLFEELNIGVGSAITDREVIRQYLQLNMASGYIDRTRNFKIKSVFQNSAITDTVSNYDYDSFIQDGIYGPINTVIYSNSASGADSDYQFIQAENADSVALNGSNAIAFSNNLFIELLPLEAQQLIVDRLLMIVDNYSYMPVDINLFAKPYYDPFDTYTVSNMKGVDSILPITSITYNYNGGLIGTIKTERLPETLPEAQIPNIFERVTNAEIIVNRLDNYIYQVVSDVGSYNDRIELIETNQMQTSTALEQEVIDRVTQGENILRETSSQVEQLKNSFTIEFTNINNEIANANGDFEEWKTRYRFDDNAMTIGKTSSPLQISLTNEQMNFIENGSAIAWINGRKMYIKSLEVLESIILGNHIWEKSVITEGRSYIRKV